MSDSTTVSVRIDGQTVIIYNNRQPDVYDFVDIFDPDNPVSGKNFPSLKSLVLKGGTLYYVSARDTSTYRVTLTPVNYTVSEDNIVKIISYGNDKFCLYQDERTDPHKLVVDAKLLFYGNNLIEYSLYKVNVDGQEEIISMYLDSAGNYVSDRVPMGMVSAQYPAYKFPTNCHTAHDLSEGDIVTLRVYNNLGNQASEVTLFVRDAPWLNDLNSRMNPIMKLDAECLQMNGDDFWVYAKQDPSHLNIRPYLLYADGTKEYINIDNTQCFLYGLEGFIPSYKGYSQQLVLKYFLNYRETAAGQSSVNGRRFLTCTKNLIVVANKNTYGVKVSTIPVYDLAAGAWKLRFFGYSDKRDTVYDITDYITINQNTPFDGTSNAWGREQHIEFDYDLQEVYGTDDALPGAQAIWITVWDPMAKYERYTFRDSATSKKVYGVDGSITRRPIIHYDTNLKQYFIPSTIFQNWNAVVESFYTLACPPYDKKSETIAPTPTHFTIRDAYSGQMLIGGPIPASEYGQLWPVLVGTQKMVGQVVIVEFLQLINGTMQLLYGVPVDVKESVTGYTTKTNTIY